MGKSENLNTVRTKHIECIIGQEEFECIDNFDRENLVLISITDPTEPLVDSSLTENYKDKLEIQFYDIRKYVEGYEELIVSNELAQTIKEFIFQNKEEKFVIHCTAGISRSAAVGCAVECICEYKGNVEEYLNGNSEVKKYWRYSPNQILFNKIFNVDLPIKYS